MEDLEKAMDSMDELSSSLKKIERYNYLFYLTGRMVLTVLMFLAVAFFVYILILMNNFQEINPYLGTIRLSGAANFGTYLDLFTLALAVGAVIVFFVNVRMNRRALSSRQWEPETFDRSKGKDELLGTITRIDWAKAKSELSLAKLSFVLYNASIVGIYSFLMFFVLMLLFYFVFGLIIDLIMMALNVTYGLSFALMYIIMSILAVLISVGILRKRLRESLVELKGLDSMLNELRRFLDEFEKSGFQA